MSLHAVADVVDEGHVGQGWVKSKDPAMVGMEIPTACAKCKTPWPCSAIVKARSALANDIIKARSALVSDGFKK